MIVKSGYLLYERLPGVWRRRFLKLRAVSFDVSSRYAGPCVESSLDEDSEPLATFPLDSTRVRSGASEAGLHPMLFVDSASGASERSPRRRGGIETRGYKRSSRARAAFDSGRFVARQCTRPPPPPNEDREPERTHLFRFGVNASKKFQCVHCSFRGTLMKFQYMRGSCPDGGIKGILSCSSRNWNQATYELKGGCALVGDGQRRVAGGFGALCRAVAGLMWRRRGAGPCRSSALLPWSGTVGAGSFARLPRGDALAILLCF